MVLPGDPRVGRAKRAPPAAEPPLIRFISLPAGAGTLRSAPATVGGATPC